MSELAQVLRHVVPVADPNSLVDASTGDDAAVYRLGPDRALVVTVDFFTPIVDDPYDFGRIAVANSLSDIWAMGAEPLFGLNLVGFPREHLGSGLLEEILRGGSEACRAAGVPILGGHSIDDPEPKFGMVAVGEVHPDRMVTNARARPGDVLVLTKPLGSGVVATALKAGAAPEAVVARAVEVMAALNGPAAGIAAGHGVRAGTDVTGFGLLGHLRNLLLASGARAEIRSTEVPLLEGAVELVEAGHVPGGTRRNLADLMEDIVWDHGVPDSLQTLLVDAQTSGGLLLCVPPDEVDALLDAVRAVAPDAAVVGEVVEGRPGAVTVL